jgi:aquaporin NIP
MFVIIATATDSRAVGVMAGAAIGAAVILGVFIGGPFTGASMNPARSFGPALFEKDFVHFWVYLLGPFLGASLAVLTYENLRCESHTKEEKNPAKGCC